MYEWDGNQSECMTGRVRDAGIGIKMLGKRYVLVWLELEKDIKNVRVSFLFLPVAISSATS